jgi:hypothetical protein
VIVITSRDSDAILLLYRCLRHSYTEHELRTIFSSSQLSQKRSKLSNCTFWKFVYKRKFFFFIHLLFAKSTFNNDRRLYKEKWCDLMRIWLFNFHWNLNCTFWNLSYKRKNFFLIRSVYARTTFSVDRKLYKRRFCDLMRTWLFNFHKSLSRNVLIIQFLKQRETERICLWSMIWLNRQLSFDRWARKINQ